MTPDEADAILIAYAMNAVAGPLALQERAAFSSRDGQGMKLILAELRALYAFDHKGHAASSGDIDVVNVGVSEQTQSAIEEMRRAA